LVKSRLLAASPAAFLRFIFDHLLCPDIPYMRLHATVNYECVRYHAEALG
jgi:hypothetical protein